MRQKHPGQKAEGLRSSATQLWHNGDQKPPSSLWWSEPLWERQCHDRVTCIWREQERAGLRAALGFPGGSVIKNLPASTGGEGDTSSIPGSGRSPGWRKRQPSTVRLPEESHGQRSLVGCSPWGRKESDMTYQAHKQHSPMCGSRAKLCTSNVRREPQNFIDRTRSTMWPAWWPVVRAPSITRIQITNRRKAWP